MLVAVALPLLLAGLAPGADAATSGTHQAAVEARGLQDVVDPSDDETGTSSGSAVAPTQPSWASLLVAGPVLGLLILVAWTLAPQPGSADGPGSDEPAAGADAEAAPRGAGADGTLNPHGQAPEPTRDPDPGASEAGGEPETVDALGYPTGEDLPGPTDPADAEAGIPRILLLGRDAVDEGDLEDAVEWFETALAAEPELSVAHLCRGLALAEMGDHGEAAEAFRSATETDPGNPTARYLLAASLAQTGETREAIVHVRQVVDLVPQLADLAREDRRFDALRDDPRFLAALGDL